MAERQSSGLTNRNGLISQLNERCQFPRIDSHPRILAEFLQRVRVHESAHAVLFLWANMKRSQMPLVVSTFIGSFGCGRGTPSLSSVMSSNIVIVPGPFAPITPLLAGAANSKRWEQGLSGNADGACGPITRQNRAGIHTLSRNPQKRTDDFS